MYSATIFTVNTLLLLFFYFSLATALLAAIFLPAVRSWAMNQGRAGLGMARRLSLGWQRINQGFLRRSTSIADQSIFDAARWTRVHNRKLLLAFAVLVILPLMAVGLRHTYRVDTFDHTYSRVVDPRIAALLAGERLVSPPALPPEVFSSMLSIDLERARPLVRFASREWSLLDEDFRQRLLLVYKIMREKYSYDMVLIEGFRSAQRQTQLMEMGSRVTQAGAYMSYHQYGMAGDSAFLRNGKLVISEQDVWAMRGYQLFGQVAQDVGLVWGGAWTSLKDLGHVELRRPGILGKRPPGDGADSAHVY